MPEERAFTEWRKTGFAQEKRARRDRLRAHYAALNGHIVAGN
jgi:hypothetical protein